MIIIDASVALKWIIPEEDSNQAKAFLQQHLSKEDEIVIPDLFFYEIANTLIMKFSVPEDNTISLLHQIFQFNLNLYHPNQDDIESTISLSVKFKTTFYDMLYAVIAKKHKTVLITADEKFFNKTKFSFVKLISEYKPKN